MIRTLLSGLLALTLQLSAAAQAKSVEAAEPERIAAPASNLPDAPDAQGPGAQQAPDPAPSSPSNSGGPASNSDSEKGQREKAEEQLKQQEHQRVFGVMATFNTTRNQNAVPLDPKQKFELFFKSQTDPWPFLLSSVVAGIGQADDSEPEWGQGVQGYAKRFGSGYSDAFIGNFFGNAVLPVLLREDPRYFQKGTGSYTNRFLWAALSTVWCKRDNGKWGPNYANVGGNLIGAAISRAYYPPSERTFPDVLNDGLTVSAEGIVGAEVIEFWPDMVRHYRKKKAEKLARKAVESAKPNATDTDSETSPSIQKPRQ